MPTFPNIQGSNLTEVHSFADDTSNPNGFWVGFHNGENSPREVGTIYIDNFYSTPTFTKDRIQSEREPNAGEPSLRYHEGTLYMITRGTHTSNVEGGCSFNYKDTGGNWIGYKLPGNIHHSSVPFEIVGDMLYIYSSERSENEWNAGDPDNRWIPTRPRTIEMTVPLAEARAGNFTNFTQRVVFVGQFSGEAVASGNGVGSTVKTSSDIFYFFGTQDWRMKGQYSYNPNPTLPSGVDPWKGWGIPEDIWAVRRKLVQRAGISDYDDNSSDSRSLGVSIQNHKVLLEAPIYVPNGGEFTGRVNYRLNTGSVRIIDGVITLPNDNCSYYIIDTENSDPLDDLVRIEFLDGQTPTNGFWIGLQLASSNRKVNFKHSTGNLYMQNLLDYTLNAGQSRIYFDFYNNIFYERLRSINEAIPVYYGEADAAAAGLSSGREYRTPTGQIKFKL